TEISKFMFQNPLLLIVQIPGFLIAVITLQGKLERLPFDIPHGETEIVGGAFTEYSGGLLAFFNLAIDMEMVVGAALINAVFLGGSMGADGILAIVVFLGKTTFIVLLLSVLKAIMARIRIEQMINFCWKILAPLSLIQIAMNIALKIRIG
ncbi:MAG: NADH-quinone oxidoreductase subunit H, partial [Elusimicrobiales bacterium]|nr:NADH-quinone oxidoreductase subunit H [Elusimicrobiales bacterium]